MATFTNQASLTYNGIVTNSNIIVGELQEVLSATKTAVVDSYTADGDVTYVVSVLNTGTAPFTGLTLTDNLGSYAFNQTQVVPLSYVPGSVQFYVNGVLQAAPAVTAGPPLTITGLNVPAGGNATILYETRVNAFAPPAGGGTIVNTATLTGVGVTSDVTATATITAADAPVISITKLMSPTTVTENGQLTYTFQIQNNGNTPITAADNMVLTDTFNPILSNIAVTFNGTTWAPTTNYTYNAATGAFATVAGQIVVPAATFQQNAVTGAWEITPGVATLTVTGTV